MPDHEVRDKMTHEMVETMMSKSVEFDIGYVLFSEDMENGGDQLKRAKMYAYFAHMTQLRDGGEPYIVHPASVSNRVFEAFKAVHPKVYPIPLVYQKAPSVNKVLHVSMSVAWLHDVVEDTNVTEADLRKFFSPWIVDSVMHLTHADDASFHEILEGVASFNGVACLVKMADRLDNLNTMKHAGWNAKRMERYTNKGLLLAGACCGRLAELEQFDDVAKNLMLQFTNFAERLP